MRVLLGITVAMHVPVTLGVAHFAANVGASAPGLWGLAWGAPGVLLFTGRARSGLPERPGHPAVVRFFDIPYFIHWCAALYTLLPAVAVTVVVPLLDVVRGAPVHLPVAAYMWIYASGLLVCGYGVLIRRRWVRVVEREMKVPGLDPRFEGFRIAHLSDLHIGALTPRSWGLHWARLSNGTAPDLAVVTGDMVTSGDGLSRGHRRRGGGAPREARRLCVDGQSRLLRRAGASRRRAAGARRRRASQRGRGHRAGRRTLVACGDRRHLDATRRPRAGSGGASDGLDRGAARPRPGAFRRAPPTREPTWFSAVTPTGGRSRCRFSRTW